MTKLELKLRKLLHSIVVNSDISVSDGTLDLLREHIETKLPDEGDSLVENEKFNEADLLEMIALNDLDENISYEDVYRFKTLNK